MEIALYLMVPALLMGGLIIWAFFWSMQNKQFDDLDSPAQRILHIDERQSDENRQ